LRHSAIFTNDLLNFHSFVEFLLLFLVKQNCSFCCSAFEGGGCA
jgi:hypothetical protein